MELLQNLAIYFGYIAIVMAIGGFLLMRPGSTWKRILRIVTWPFVAPIRFCLAICKAFWNATPPGLRPLLAYSTFGVLGYKLANQPTFPPIVKQPAYVPDDLTVELTGKTDDEIKQIYKDLNNQTWNPTDLHDPAAGITMDNYFTHVFIQMRRRGFIT